MKLKPPIKSKTTLDIKTRLEDLLSLQDYAKELEIYIQETKKGNNHAPNILKKLKFELFQIKEVINSIYNGKTLHNIETIHSDKIYQLAPLNYI